VKRATNPDPLDRIPRLSVREFEVFSMIGDGKGTREIAAALRISTKTVETHRDRIKQKLGITGSTELTVRAVRARLERGE
jgi:DNA-binding NarL/FixJ family response regulator